MRFVARALAVARAAVRGAAVGAARAARGSRSSSSCGDGAGWAGDRRRRICSSNPHTRDLLVNGAFPTGIRFRARAVAQGRLCSTISTAVSEWDVLVSYDPTQADSSTSFASSENSSRILAASRRSPRPRRSSSGRSAFRSVRVSRGSYYYNLIVEVQTLTETDLDALQHWLRGTKAQGSNNPLSWLGKGMGSLLSRVLGGDKRHYRAAVRECSSCRDVDQAAEALGARRIGHGKTMSGPASRSRDAVPP